MRTFFALMLLAVAIDAHADSKTTHSSSSSGSDDAARRAREEEAAAEQQRHGQEDGQRVSQLLGLDLRRIRTVGLWPGKDLPCKLPDNEFPFVCHRLIEGPAIILSRMELVDVVVARDDKALTHGARVWWSQGIALPVPLVLGPGEVLYHVGGLKRSRGDGDLVVTVYR